MLKKKTFPNILSCINIVVIVTIYEMPAMFQALDLVQFNPHNEPVMEYYFLPFPGEKIIVQLLLLLFNHSVISDFLQPHGLQHASFPVLHHLLEFAQTHVHCVSDAIQLSHPLSPPSPFALNLSWHNSLFWWVGSWYQVVKVLELELQHQSFQWILRVDLL